MAAQKRQPHTDIAQDLREKAFGYNFFKAVHLLERLGNKSLGNGLSPDDDPVRFSVQPGIAFPASDIQNIDGADNGRAPRMTVNFMGLVGPKGVLPDWYSTHARNCQSRKDYCFTDFLDIFHHRIISLFYQSWKKYRLVENHTPDGTDPISGVLEGLAGISERERVADPEFFQYVKKRLIYFCGLVGRNVPTAAAIETIVGHATGASVHIEQFVERLIRIHEHDRTCLGRRNSTLNKDALCGRSVRDGGSFFRVHIGPMSWTHYMAFAPRSRNLAMVKQMILYLAGVEYEFEVRLIIRGDEIPALGLGDRGQAPVLGRTVLLRRPNKHHAGDVVVRTCTDPAGRPGDTTKGNHGGS